MSCFCLQSQTISQVNYYVIRPLCAEDYFVVGSRQEGSPWETVDIVRKFSQTEDRDAYEARLKKSRCEFICSVESE